MPTEQVRSNGQHEMGAIADRKHEQQAGRMPYPDGIESFGKLTSRPRGEDRLCGGSGKRTTQTIFETGDEFVKIHERTARKHYRFGTTDMKLQLPCGAGYEVDVTARTTSPAMNAYPASFG